MYFLMAIAAALAYTTGGIFMKLSAGFSQITPSLLVYLFFLLGASLQICITHNAHLGVTYMAVMGLEAMWTILFSLLVFKEGYSPLTLVGIFLIGVGTIFLRAEMQ